MLRSSSPEDPPRRPPASPTPTDNETVYTYTDPADPGFTVKQSNLVKSILRPTLDLNTPNPFQYPETEMKYDSNGNLLEILQYIDGTLQSTSMTYELDGLVKTVSDFNGNTTVFSYEGVAHDGLTSRNLLEVQTPKGLTAGDGTRKVMMEYDDYDNVTKVTDDLGNVMKFFFDDLDRLKWTEDPRGFKVEYDYLDGLLTEVRNPLNNGATGLNRKTTFTHDTSGRVTEVLQQNGGAQELRVGYEFDGLSQMLKLSRLQNGVSKSFNFDYDPKGRNTSVIDPLENVTKSVYAAYCGSRTQISARGSGVRHLSDARCLPSSKRNLTVNGNSIETHQFFHDELGRLFLVIDKEITKYGEAVHGFDNYSSKVSGENGAYSYTNYLYDEVDRVTDIFFGGGKTMHYEYDPVGNVTKMTDPEGKVTKYEYFRDNLLHKAIFERNGVDVGEFVYSYDLAGRPATITYPASTGIVAKFEDDAGTANSGFDPNGNLLNLRYEKNNVLIRRFEWTYDDSNNRQSQLEFVPATQTEPSKAIKWEYGFDWFDRLVSVRRAEATTVAGLPSVPLKNLDPTYLQREYVFDESDNRKYFDDHVNGKTYHYKYKSIDDNGTIRYSDQLEEILISNSAGDRDLDPQTTNFTSLETFEHDADGNMTKRIKTGEEITFQWSDYDRLLRVESDQTGRKQDNRYDFNGIRKRKLDKNGNSSREYTASISTSSSRTDLGSTSVPTVSYLSIGGAIVGYEEDDGTTSEFRFFLTDALSSVRDIVDSNGAVVQSYEYDELGNQLPGSGQGSVHTPKTYWGGLSVNDDTGDSGLYLAGHRHFDPGLGRFISRDPIGFAGGLNLYALSANNQVTYTDPTGLEPGVVTSSAALATQLYRHLAVAAAEGIIAGARTPAPPQGKFAVGAATALAVAGTPAVMAAIQGAPGMASPHHDLKWALLPPNKVAASSFGKDRECDQSSKVALFHGSIRNSKSILASGLTFTAGRSTSVTPDLATALEAVGPFRYDVQQGLVKDPAIIISLIDRKQYNQHFAPHLDTNYTGFGGKIQGSQILMKTQTQHQLFNSGIVGSIPSPFR